VAAPFVHDSADVDDDVEIGSDTSIWHLVHVRAGARIGSECNVGRGAYIGPGVAVGDRTKIQNLAQVYEPARVGRGVFIGPGVILTNDVYPRAVGPDMTPKGADDWEAVGVTIGDGAAIGARSVVLAGVTIGDWALVGAGSTVVRDVPAYALVVGNPAVQRGWVGRAGQRLEADDGSQWRCPATGERYELDGDRMDLASDG
jgi:acetyltransferase-like isoleucine patch superfamily enzyme